MAGKVVLDQQGMSIFAQELLNYHLEVMSGITKVQKQMRRLNEDEDIFHMDKISKNIKNLMDLIDSEMIPSLKEVVNDTNKCADDLIKIMNGIDR